MYYTKKSALGLLIGVGLAFMVGCTKEGADPVVAEFNGVKVKASEAFGPIKTRIFNLEEELYRTKEQAVNDYVEQKLLEMEAAKRKVPIEQLLEQEAGGPVGDISNSEIEEFLKSKGIDPADPKIRKEDVKNYLTYKKRFDKRQGYLGKLREGAKVKVHLKEPESPKIDVATEGYPSWGNPKAPVTIVEFSDFQCPYCARAVPTIERIKQEYGQDKVRIVFRDMPLPSHPKAAPASLAARCANEQGKFWEMHNHLFNNQTKLEDADLKTYAKDIGLDTGKFNECFDQKRHMASIDKSREDAERLGIQATPSFVINGALLEGAQPFERFKEKIDRGNKG